MNATLKKYLVIAIKHAVNAGLLAVFEIMHDPKDNNFHDWHGIQGILWTIGTAIAIREFVVWVPKLLKWSQDVPTEIVATVETTTTVHPTDLNVPETQTHTTTEVLGPIPIDKPKS